MRCPLCGYTFDADSMACHASCAFNQHCAIICCPNCGYQMTDESKSRLARAFRRLLGHNADADGRAYEGIGPLTALRTGQSATVVSVDEASHARQEHLSVFGLMPGARITLQQRRPAFVLRVGQTELSLEHEIARQIVVRAEGD